MSEPDNTGIKLLPPLALLVVVLLCVAAEIWLGPPHFPAPPAIFIFGIALAMAGLLLGASGLRRFFALGVHPSPTKSVPRVVTGGAYRFTRNPMYLGIETLLIGVALAFGSYAFLAGALVMFLYFSAYVIPREEAYMARKFGPEYRDFCSRVRRWI